MSRVLSNMSRFSVKRDNGATIFAPVVNKVVGGPIGQFRIEPGQHRETQRYLSFDELGNLIVREEIVVR